MLESNASAENDNISRDQKSITIVKKINGILPDIIMFSFTKKKKS